MTNKPCGVVWYELMTSDSDGAGRFYAEVCGWRIDATAQQPNGYRFIHGPLGPLGATMPLPPGSVAMGMRPCWTFYLSVADCDAAAAAVAADGGAIHMPGTDVPGAGRFAFVSDPQGAMFYVMKTQGAGPAISHRPETPGFGGWHELHTSDGDAAMAFYAKHFGWTPDGAHDMGAMGPYRLFKTDTTAQAGGIMNDANAPRPYWTIYFNVDSIAAAAERLKAAGGTILHGPAPVPSGAWTINAQDPQGAFFGLVGPQ